MGSIGWDAESETQNARTDVTVLVTGFGPFQEKYPVNPSFEITRLLPEVLPRLTVDGRKIHIIAYDTPVRVCYDEVRTLVPVLHDSLKTSVDLVLHIGMASGRTFYTAELYGHRDGYSKNKDLDGKTVSTEDGLEYFGDCPAMMTTSLDYDEVLRGWNLNLLKVPEDSPGFGAECRPSENAGHYLCDYIYYNSLAWYGRQHNRLDGGEASDRPVLFLHVPADSSPEALARGKQVTLALIQSMVDSWCLSEVSRNMLRDQRAVPLNSLSEMSTLSAGS